MRRLLGESRAGASGSSSRTPSTGTVALGNHLHACLHQIRSYYLSSVTLPLQMPDRNRERMTLGCRQGESKDADFHDPFRQLQASIVTSKSETVRKVLTRPQAREFRALQIDPCVDFFASTFGTPLVPRTWTRPFQQGKTNPNLRILIRRRL